GREALVDVAGAGGGLDPARAGAQPGAYRFSAQACLRDVGAVGVAAGAVAAHPERLWVWGVGSSKGLPEPRARVIDPRCTALTKMPAIAAGSFRTRSAARPLPPEPRDRRAACL